jgi:DNA-binding NarL/FixJ family response regulator
MQEMKETGTNLGLVVARPGLVREGLQAVLSAIPGIDALEPADDGASALDRLKSHRLALAVLDSSLSEDELCKTLRQIKEQWPYVRCIVIAGSPGQGRAVEAVGADAVLVEGSSAALLSTTIKALLTEA